MFFVLSKIIYFMVAPSHLCLIALGSGVVMLSWTGTQRLARWLLMASLTGFVGFGFSPLGNVLIWPLEQRFPPSARLEDGIYAGIIFLGGFEDGDISRGRNNLALIDAAERLSETVRLARRLPSAKVIFTGGAASAVLPAFDAAGAVLSYLRDVGVDAGRIVLESHSRNTWENATFTRRIVRPAATDRFLLVTSAWHMPRAMGAFRKAGFRVDAYPVDYRTSGAQDLNRPFSFLPNGLRRMDKAVKEWLGLLVYYLTERSSALLPGPGRKERERPPNRS